ncbi:hypothetical protein [Flocculibacter collagenilyticus]|uniref:hypothetical protein n=1 Tax=Flocculibacter collagenilyticus TaxID=2744479 RepID=UPI0018F5511F|nr:hypothetical protein [Flocculibacter collagenilyticus]
MKNLLKPVLVIATLFVTGCAHQIQISPNLTQLEESENKSDAVVGYYIAKEEKNRKVVTPGGGGDKITYTPYKDTEAALHKVLSGKFKNVWTVASLDDKKFIEEQNISLIFIPKIVTDSSSKSLMTWPATDFTFNLTIKALDKAGNLVWDKTVTGKGHAEFKEFVKDFGLSAHRASEEAFKKLAVELNNSAKL